MKPEITVYKYRLPILATDGPNVIQFTNHAEVLTVHDQDDIPTIWVEEYPRGQERLEEKYDKQYNNAPSVFWVFGTGWDIASYVEPTEVNLKYIGSTFTDRGLVWHVYQEVLWK